MFWLATYANGNVLMLCFCVAVTEGHAETHSAALAQTDHPRAVRRVAGNNQRSRRFGQTRRLKVQAAVSTQRWLRFEYLWRPFRRSPATYTHWDGEWWQTYMCLGRRINHILHYWLLELKKICMYHRCSESIKTEIIKNLLILCSVNIQNDFNLE